MPTRAIPQLLEVEAAMRSLAARLTAELLSLAGRPGAQARWRGPLVQLRRDVHNARPPDRRRLEALADVLPAPVAAACDAFHALAVRRDELRAAAERRFAEESAASRAGAGTTFALRADPGIKRSAVRLNKNLHRALLDRLQSHPSVRGQLPVELNPGLEIEGNSWVFLAQISSRETFPRLPRVAGLDRVADWLRRQRAASCDEVAERLLELRLFGDRSRAVAFVDRLLAIGFLRFQPLAPELDAAWDLPLRRFLAGCAAPAARSVAALLGRLRRWALAYPQAGLEQRRRLLSQAADTLRARFASGAADVDARLQGLVFFEDAATPATLSIARPPLFEVEAHLAEYLAFAARLTPQREEQARMRAYFQRSYPGSTAVPLRRFAEAYCRDYFGGYV
ncbi:MAG TPA: lantibiotic dehydratase, partial [Thermoanaerobaculia bacterium]|nr:lantibiotic dehydratase [Thermoanaerobaculia bacterium]